VDVTVIPDDEIKTHKKAALLEYVQKHIRAWDINSRLQDIVALLGLAQPTKEQVVGLLKYLAQEENTLDSETFFRNLRAHTPRYREEMMTVAEQLRLEGRQEGLQEGVQKGRREIARNFLALGVDRTTVERATGLSHTELDALTHSES